MRWISLHENDTVKAGNEVSLDYEVILRGQKAYLGFIPEIHLRPSRLAE